MERCKNCGHILRAEAGLFCCDSCGAVKDGEEWLVPGALDKAEEREETEAEVLARIDRKILESSEQRDKKRNEIEGAKLPEGEIASGSELGEGENQS